jgi:hypothetical protein
MAHLYSMFSLQLKFTSKSISTFSLLARPINYVIWFSIMLCIYKTQSQLLLQLPYNWEASSRTHLAWLILDFEDSILINLYCMYNCEKALIKSNQPLFFCSRCRSWVVESSLQSWKFEVWDLPEKIIARRALKRRVLSMTVPSNP